MNVSAASEGLLFFGVFCLQAEWVHSENVTSCLVALHHQLPFLSVFLFTQCLFVYCVKLCSFMLIALCCGVVHSSAGKHLRGYLFGSWLEFFPAQFYSVIFKPTKMQMQMCMVQMSKAIYKRSFHRHLWGILHLYWSLMLDVLMLQRCVYICFAWAWLIQLTITVVVVIFRPCQEFKMSVSLCACCYHLHQLANQQDCSMNWTLVNEKKIKQKRWNV